MTKPFNIRQAGRDDTAVLTDIIRQSYQTVALDFNLTPENCPKHPSNCTGEWIKSDLDRGVIYYILLEGGRPLGCAALEKADPKTCYLERLAVMPEVRHKGYGKLLVDFIIEKARICKAKTLGAGIIDEQAVLKQWYRGLGFKAVGTKKFDHLPFTVGFMRIDLS